MIDAMTATPDIGWLTIHVREPTNAELAATLRAVALRASACGLRAATIAYGEGESWNPRQPAEAIVVPDGVGGTVTIADAPPALHEFVHANGDVIPAEAFVRLILGDDVVELGRSPVAH